MDSEHPAPLFPGAGRSVPPSVVRFHVVRFVLREDRRERIGSVENFLRRIEEASEGPAAFGVFAGRFGFVLAREVIAPAMHVVVELSKVPLPARGFALPVVEPAEQIEPVHRSEPRLGCGEILLHAREHRVPDDEIER